MSSIDKAYENYYNYKSSDRDYILNVNGYEPAEKNIFEKAYDVIKPGGTFETEVQPVLKDMGKGAVRGVAKLTEGVTTLIAAGAEKFILGPEALAKLDPEGDGIVKDIGEFYKRNVYDKIGDTETLAGGLTEGLAQFIVPGVGYYKLFNGLIKAKGMLPFITRALAAETATVGTAQVAGDPNFVSFIAETFDIETKDAETIASRYFEYLKTPEDVTDGVTADEVLAEKWKAIQGDIVLGPVGEAIGPLLTKFFSGVKKMKKGTFNNLDKKTIDSINTKMSDQNLLDKKLPIDEFDDSKTVKLKKPNKLFDDIISGKKDENALIVFKEGTPQKIKDEYVNIDFPMTIDQNIRGSELQNKYVKKTLDMEFIEYVGANYPPKEFETIMKKVGIDPDLYE